MSTIFFTGFPGFLGVELLPRVLGREPDATAVCLVQPRFAALAQRRAAEIVEATPDLDGRIRLAEGDITRPGLGIDDPDAEAREVSQVWHLAAVYDLSVPRPVAMSVNIDGTRNVLDVAERAADLHRVHYVSSCYVSGRYSGPFSEEDLDLGQRFSNHYEETKFLAEVDVRARATAGMPVTIYRPSVVVGDSTTGATQKYDGPYYALQLLLRQPEAFALLPVTGDPTAFRFNMVPRDFVVSGIAALAGLPEALGRTYALADPNPLTVDELITAMAEATHRRVTRVPVPAGPAKWVIGHVPGVQRLLRVPPNTLDYLAHPTHYVTTNASRDLGRLGITCPPARSYLPTLVDFMRRHRELTTEAMT